MRQSPNMESYHNFESTQWFTLEGCRKVGVRTTLGIIGWLAHENTISTKDY